MENWLKIKNGETVCVSVSTAKNVSEIYKYILYIQINTNICDNNSRCYINVYLKVAEKQQRHI